MRGRYPHPPSSSASCAITHAPAPPTTRPSVSRATEATKKAAAEKAAQLEAEKAAQLEAEKAAQLEAEKRAAAGASLLWRQRPLPQQHPATYLSPSRIRPHNHPPFLRLVGEFRTSIRPPPPCPNCQARNAPQGEGERLAMSVVGGTWDSVVPEGVWAML